MGQSASEWKRRLSGPLPLLLVLALMQGLVYLATVPPWNVPDEPQRFVYLRRLWLESQGLPTTSEAVEREILASMVRQRWYQVNRTPPPTPEPVDFRDVPFFSLTAVADERQPPAYYQLVRLVMLLAGQTTVDAQLYVARFVSVVLGVLTTAAAYAVARTVFPRDRQLTILVPAVVALLPQRAFISGGVNNDNLAVLAASLVFLALIRLLAGGVSVARLGALVVSCVLVATSKVTAFAVVPGVLVVGIGAAVIAPARRWAPKSLVFVAVAVFVATIVVLRPTFDPCQPLHWTVNGDGQCARFPVANPAGQYALRVADRSTVERPTLYQQLPGDAAYRLRGRTVTFGMWVRSESDVQTASVRFSDGRNAHTLAFTAYPEWRFYSRTLTVATEPVGLHVILGATHQGVEGTGDILYSGVLVVEGDLSQEGAPEQISGWEVVWNGVAFTNAVRNTSGEAATYQPSPVVEIALRVVPRASGLIRAAQNLLDPAVLEPGGIRAYASYTSVMLNSFWGLFGWMGLPLPDELYSALQGLTLLSLVGATGFLIRRWLPGAKGGNSLQRQAVALSLFLVLVGFAMAFFREIPPYGQTQGRYALPIVVPFAITFCVGLRTLCPERLRRWLPVALLAGFVALNLVSVLGVIVPASYGPR